MELKGEAPDSLIAQLAARQHRVVSRKQLLRAGVGAEAIRHRVASKRLFAVHRGVYSVGTADPGPLGRFLAAVLACGEGAVLSHRSAAVLWRLLDDRPGPIEVTLPGKKTAARRGIRVHSTRSLPSDDTTSRLRIPCTSVERTLVDLAASRPDELERAVEQAFVLKLIGRTRMADVLGRSRGRTGTRTLRRLLAGLLPQLPATRSELERRFLKLVRAWGLPEPVVNRRRETHRVDFVWEKPRLVVETDGRGSHDNPFAYERDRERDLDLELAGWRVLRFSWRQVIERPEQVAEVIAARLSAAARAR